MTGYTHLVVLAKKGDGEAFGELVERFQDWAVGYAYSIVGDFRTAEDAAQESFINAFERIEQLREPDAFPGWLRQIVRTHCSRLTRGMQVPTIDLDDAPPAVSLHPEPSEAVESSERRSEVRKAVLELPERERSIVALFYMGEHSYREISAFLQLPVSTVKSRLYSGRQRLKARLVEMVKDDIEARKPSRNREFVENVARGLRGVYVDETLTSHIDGEAPALLYRGYSIDDLVEKASFEETAHLLIAGSLPNRGELDRFEADLRSGRSLPREVDRIVRDCPMGKPVDVLRTAVSMLSVLDPEAEDLSSEANRRRAIRLTAIAPTIVAAHARICEGKDPVRPDPDLGYAENFLYMLFDEKPEPEVASLFERDLTLHADHGLNASTLAARVAASTGADLYSAVTSALGALKGPDHGGAGERVAEMLDAIGGPEDVESYLGGLLANGGYVPGFGHAVYRVRDPRSTHLAEGARSLAKRRGEVRLVETLDAIEAYMEREAESGIAANLDLWSSALYRLIGIRTRLYAAVFALGRMPGWAAHVMEQYERNMLLRPRLRYVGEMDREFVPVEARG